jgi:hypothetical protein
LCKSKGYAAPKVEPKGQEKSAQSNNSVDHVTAVELFEMFCTGLKNEGKITTASSVAL